MNKISVVLPRGYPQSREGRKMYSAEQAAVNYKETNTPGTYMCMSEQSAGFRMAMPAKILYWSGVVTHPFQALQAKPLKRLLLMGSKTPAMSLRNFFAPKCFSSKLLIDTRQTLAANHLSCKQRLYLSILSPGGTQLRHIPVPGADMLMQLLHKECRICKFKHWFWQQQAIPRLSACWQNVFSRHKPILPQQIFDSKAAFVRAGTVF
jgi:hypothetical protein